jgi:hypothetical protein
MSPEQKESHAGRVESTPLRDLGLTITGSDLEGTLHVFEEELRQCGITRLRPKFYLSTEWGVPFGTVSIAIPFYLARADLTALHAERSGYVEGVSRADILRYLRHEMGHVVNYAYRLYEEPDWARLFGDINKDYEEEYHPRQFSRDFVRHLPGWYAQKHPDEDWAETFAVWMAPGGAWRQTYAGWPGALAKLEYCQRTMTRLRDQDPPVTEEDADEDVRELAFSLDDYYQGQALEDSSLPDDPDGVLRSLFDDLGLGPGPARPAAGLIRRLERPLMAEVFHWTGYFPERTRWLLRNLAQRAEQHQHTYPEGRDLEAGVALATFITAWAINHMQTWEGKK